MGARASQGVDYVAMPRNLNEAEEFINQIGEKLREMDVVEIELEAEIAKLKAEALKKSKEKETELEELVKGFYQYAQANWDDLSHGNKQRCIKLVTGEFGKRHCSAAVEVVDEEKAIEELEKLGQEQCVRVVKSIDKTEVKKLQGLVDKLENLKITKAEVFYITPSRVKLVKIKKKRNSYYHKRVPCLNFGLVQTRPACFL